MSSTQKMTEDECRTAQVCESETDGKQTPKKSKIESSASHVVIKNMSDDGENGASANTSATIHHDNNSNGKAQVVANSTHEVFETKSLEQALTQEPTTGPVINFCSSTSQALPLNAPRLPPEIRHMIAEAAVLDPLSLSVKVNRPLEGSHYTEIRVELEYGTGKTFDDIASCLGLLRNPERDAALWNSFLEKSFEASVFHLIIDNTGAAVKIIDRCAKIINTYSPVKHLSINIHDVFKQSKVYHSRPTVHTLVRVIQAFPCLKRLSIVYGDGRPQKSEDNVILGSLDTSSSNTTPKYTSQGRALRPEVVEAYMLKSMIISAMRGLDDPWVEAEDLEFNIVP